MENDWSEALERGRRVRLPGHGLARERLNSHREKEFILSNSLATDSSVTAECTVCYGKNYKRPSMLCRSARHAFVNWYHGLEASQDCCIS
jgi:hypothetical protein